jgi:hypothetical protein
MALTLPRTLTIVVLALLLALGAARARNSEPATADDTARFLAGMPPSLDSPLSALTKDPVWLSHARYPGSDAIVCLSNCQGFPILLVGT